MEERIASLTIDGSQAQRELDAIAQGFSKVGTAADGTSSAMERNTRRIAEQDREYKRLITSIGGTVPAMERFNSLQGKLDRDLAAGALTAQQHATALDKLSAKYIDGAGAASTMQTQMEKLNAEVQRANSVFAAFHKGDIVQAQSTLVNFTQQVTATGNATQAFAVQAPELLGLFTKLPAPVMAATTAVVAFGAGAAVVGARVASIASEARTLDTTLRALNPSLRGFDGRGAAFDVAGATGASRSDATAAISALIRQRDLSAGLIRDLAGLAQEMGAVLGDDPAKAAGRLGEAFSKGAAGIRKLDEELGFLSPEMAQTIRQMDEAGNRSGALALAVKGLEDRFGGAGKAMQSEFGKALSELSKEFDSFLERLAKSDPAQAAGRFGAGAARGFAQWLRPADPADADRARMADLDAQIGRKQAWLRDALGNGESGRGVDRAREELRQLQEEYYRLAGAMRQAQEAQEAFGAGQSGRWRDGAWDSSAARQSDPGGVSESERKRLDQMVESYEKERAAMAGSAAERSVRLAGLAAERDALDAGRSAGAALEERLLAERRARDALQISIRDQIDAAREELRVARELADAKATGTATDLAAIRAAAEYRRTIREGGSPDQAREAAGLSAERGRAEIQGDLNDLARRQREAFEISRAEFDLLGLTNAERAKETAMLETRNELLRKGADLNEAGSQAYIRQAGEIAKMRATVADNASLAGDLSQTVTGGTEAALFGGGKVKGLDVLRAAGNDIGKIAVRQSITKPFETWLTGNLTKMLNGDLPALDANNTPTAKAVSVERLLADAMRTNGGALPVRVVAVEGPGGPGIITSTMTHAANSNAAVMAGGFDLPSLVKSVIYQESRGNPNAVSKSGRHFGLMQLSEAAAKDVGWIGEDLSDPEINRYYGTKYLLKQIAEQGDVQWGLAAYNAGGANVAKWRAAGLSYDQIPFPETKAYVREVKDRLWSADGGADAAAGGGGGAGGAAASWASFAAQNKGLFGSALGTLGAATRSPMMGVGGSMLSLGGPRGVLDSLGALGQKLDLFGKDGLTGDLTGFLNKPLYSSAGSDFIGPMPAGETVTAGNVIGGASGRVTRHKNFKAKVAA